MQSFSELLRGHIERDGISDAELARSIGVGRQTIFRWKEGTVARPRHRDDVLALAAKLRLTAAERDELLIAAGFRPESLPEQAQAAAPVSPAPGSSGAATPEEVRARERPPGSASVRPALSVETEESAASQAPVPIRKASTLFLGLLGLVFVALAFAGWLWWRQARLPVAMPGETLVVVSRFTNFAGQEVGFNVAGRITERLEQEVAATGLTNVRVVTWPRSVADTAAAQEVLARSQAQLIIWGEYDSGRVMTRLLSTGIPQGSLSEFEAQLATPAELTATINSTVPEEVRTVALLALGQLYSDSGEYYKARSVLEQALRTPPIEADALASLHFRLGLAYQLGNEPEREKAIEQYNLALIQEPDHISARYNRGLAFLFRLQPGDLDRALEDFNAVLDRNPGYVPALVGRGVTHFYRGEEGPAIADFTEAIRLDDRRHLAYYNRGLLAIRQNDRAAWEADLLKVVELAPDFADGHAAVCWGYVLANEPDNGIPFCDRAINLGAAPALDSRAIAYALKGDFELARGDFHAFLGWLSEQPASSPYQRLEGRIREWLALLDTDRNPITPDVLEALRLE